MTGPTLITADSRPLLNLTDLFSKTSVEAERASCEFNTCTDGAFIQIQGKALNWSYSQFELRAEISTTVKKSNHNPKKFNLCYYVTGSPSNNIEYYDTSNTLVDKKPVVVSPTTLTSIEQNSQEVKLSSLIKDYYDKFSDGYFIICDAQTQEDSGYITGKRAKLVANYSAWSDAVTSYETPSVAPGQKTQGIVEIVTYKEMADLVYHYGNNTAKPDMIMVLHTASLDNQAMKKLISLDQAKPFILASK